MKSNLRFPNINILSFSCVFAWSRIVSIPQLDQQKARNLFGSPQTTNFTLDLNGLTIMAFPKIEPAPGAQTLTLTIAPRPQVNIGPARYVNYNPSLDDLLSSHDALAGQFNEIDASFITNLAVSQFGINLEFELDLGENLSAPNWLQTRFPLTTNHAQFKGIHVDEFKFHVIEEPLAKLTAVAIQPRVNKASKLFVVMNDHYGISPLSGFSTSADLKIFFDKSVEKFKNHIVPLLLAE